MKLFTTLLFFVVAVGVRADDYPGQSSSYHPLGSLSYQMLDQGRTSSFRQYGVWFLRNQQDLNRYYTSKSGLPVSDTYIRPDFSRFEVMVVQAQPPQGRSGVLYAKGYRAGPQGNSLLIGMKLDAGYTSGLPSIAFMVLQIPRGSVSSWQMTIENPNGTRYGG